MGTGNRLRRGKVKVFALIVRGKLNKQIV